MGTIACIAENSNVHLGLTSATEAARIQTVDAMVELKSYLFPWLASRASSWSPTVSTMTTIPLPVPVKPVAFRSGDSGRPVYDPNRWP